MPTELIHTRLAAVLAEFPVVGKDQRNPSQGYSYRGIDDALGHLHGLLAKHGLYLSIRWGTPTKAEVGQTRSGAKQWCTLLEGSLGFVCSEDGSVVDISMVGEAIDAGDKGLMKAQANALKYAIWYTFCVPTFEVKDSEAFPDEPVVYHPAGEPAMTDPVQPSERQSLPQDWVKRIRACRSVEKLEQVGSEAKLALAGLDPGDEVRIAAQAEYRRKKEMLTLVVPHG